MESRASALLRYSYPVVAASLSRLARRARILTPAMAALHNPGPSVSVIIPVLDEAGRIAVLLSRLRSLGECQIIVVDGGSRDGTIEKAEPLANVVDRSERGRARQMNAGARRAGGEVLWFVHADTLPPPGALNAIRETVRGGGVWGRFDVRLEGRQPAFRVIERFINWRSALSGIATGDQGIFVTRQAFEAVGGWPDIPLMEDVAMSRLLKRLRRPALIRSPVVCSSRRWEEHGVWRTVWLMWRLRFAYWRGADPEALAAAYTSQRGR